MRIPAILFYLCLCSTSCNADQTNYRGHILAFNIITAIRNYSFQDGMVAAQVSISVQGGNQSDWLATAVYVAEQAIVGDVTFSTVEIYFPTPWGDKPPTGTKQLAKAYYAGPNPIRSPWPDDQWSITARGQNPTLPDIEFDTLSGDLLGKMNPDDPEKNADLADRKARRMIIKKYRLPASWSANQRLGAMDPSAVAVKRNQVTVVDNTNAASSLAALHACLTNGGSGQWRGCQDNSADYSFDPTLDNRSR